MKKIKKEPIVIEALTRDTDLLAMIRQINILSHKPEYAGLELFYASPVQSPDTEKKKHREKKNEQTKKRKSNTKIN